MHKSQIKECEHRSDMKVVYEGANRTQLNDESDLKDLGTIS